MRKIILLAAAFVAACGGGSSDNPGPTPLSGTIGGQPFTPIEVKALVVGTASTPCTQIPVIGTAGVKGIALEITSYANACGDFASATCAYHQNAKTVTVLLARLNPATPTNTNPAEPTIPAGTYAINGLTALNPTDMSVGYAQAIVTDATCNGGSPTPLPSAAGGSIRIDQTVGPTPTGPITGHLSVTFQGGGSMAGDFSAALCSETPNVCGLALQGRLCDPTNATCAP
jgi:hypothetical protein